MGCVSPLLTDQQRSCCSRVSFPAPSNTVPIPSSQLQLQRDSGWTCHHPTSNCALLPSLPCQPAHHWALSAHIPGKKNYSLFIARLVLFPVKSAETAWQGAGGEPEPERTGGWRSLGGKGHGHQHLDELRLPGSRSLQQALTLSIGNLTICPLITNVSTSTFFANGNGYKAEWMTLPIPTRNSSIIPCRKKTTGWGIHYTKDKFHPTLMALTAHKTYIWVFKTLLLLLRAMKILKHETKWCTEWWSDGFPTLQVPQNSDLAMPTLQVPKKMIQALYPKNAAITLSPLRSFHFRLTSEWEEQVKCLQKRNLGMKRIYTKDITISYPSSLYKPIPGFRGVCDPNLTPTLHTTKAFL